MNPDDVDIVQIPIEQAETGMSLAIKHDGHAILFQVENKKFAYTVDSGTTWTLESEPLEVTALIKFPQWCSPKIPTCEQLSL